MCSFLNRQNVVGVEFVLSKWGNVFSVGRLLYHSNNKTYSFQYYEDYLRLQNMPPITAEFPRCDTVFTSNKLFSSFNWFIADEHVDQRKTSKNIIQRLCDIEIEALSIKTYPIYNLPFTTDMFFNWCDGLNLSLKTICPFFGVSRSLIKNMKRSQSVFFAEKENVKGVSPGKDTLPHLALYYYIEEAFDFLLQTNGHYLNPIQKECALKWKRNHFKKPFKITKLDDKKTTDEKGI